MGCKCTEQIAVYTQAFVILHCCDTGQCPQLWHNRRKVQSLGFMVWNMEIRLKYLQYIVNITVQKSIRNTDFYIYILLF